MSHERKILLHIGAGKCGSSSLQRSLSLRPVLTGPAGRHEYCVLGAQGELLRGGRLTRIAESSVYGYASCPDIAADDTLAGVKRGMARLAEVDAAVTPILSNEGWNLRADTFRDHRILGDAGLLAEAVLYIRPPLDWLNSAWWQWGAWSGHARDHWMRRNLPKCRWNLIARDWAAVPGVSDVRIRLATGDVVEDFGTLLGQKLAPVGRVNSSADGALVRALQKLRAFRPGPHDPTFEFLFSRWAPGPRRPLPWVIPPEDCAVYLRALRPHVTDLLGRLDPDQAGRVRADPRWWSADAYSGKTVEPAGAEALSTADCEELLGRAFGALRACAAASPAVR